MGHITTCKDVDGYRTFFNKPLDYQFGSCADPNGGNSYKSLRANSCDHCAEFMQIGWRMQLLDLGSTFLGTKWTQTLQTLQELLLLQIFSLSSRTRKWIKNQKKWI